MKSRKKNAAVYSVEIDCESERAVATTAPTAPQALSRVSTATDTHPAPPRVEATRGAEPGPQLRTPSARRQGTDGHSPSSCESASKKARRLEPGPKVLPAQYQFCNTSDLVILISDMLAELVSLNDKLPLNPNGLTRFHSRAPPGISIQDYLSRLFLHLSLQPAILLSMVYYIDMLSTHYPLFTISSLTVHRFLITAATVATKGLCDSFLVNGFYARVGGVSLVELNMLELEFLMRVGWRIVPRPGLLEDYYRSLAGRLKDRYRVGEVGEVDLRGIGYAGKRLDEIETKGKPDEGKGTKTYEDTSRCGLQEELPEVGGGDEEVLKEVWRGWEAFGTPPEWMLGERWARED
ncbi:cyclin-domain-containing protein [Ascobolus immersus RN42]|uniref:Cyclin-domain-containing protein n=1 Tax=Ascobolus immersus RN42 TaxID=1160509 RepID=A0A3N4HVI0_ASCIM|nr:cyclin-domain-containing protein [Ascobolus immersus RN42]